MWNSKILYTSVFGISFSIFSLAANALVVSGNQVYDLPWGEDNVDVLDTSTLNINNIHGASFINAYQQSTVNAYNADFIARLNMYDDSTANIYSGYYSWIQLFNNSTANLYSGIDTSWFLMAPDTQVNVFGRHVDYFNGRVTGMANDGSYYNIELRSIDNNGYILEDTFPTNVTLNSVPLPAPLILFLSGLVILSRLGRRKGNLFSGCKQVQAAAN
ncbi:MAG: hypothetical protein KZQ78_16040 [Candidatus Thiodiazotropha sp. (ex Ustalcina ferruginea)]|nr:hypothetical protein [Candidatus Thiodiazotropha sp. (ex Ustalcina ferruginea)]